jgi:release factor glutamine methyltransferase
MDDGRLEAELLLAHVLGVERLQLYLQFDRPIHEEELARFKSLLQRRLAREPLQYIIGRAGFREIELKTDARALIPRPETEILVGEVLAWAESETTELRGLDIGIGSGAIALSLLREGPFRRVVGTDPSEQSLELAWENALALEVDDRLELRSGALFEPLAPGERFDVVVSNPPYIPETDRDGLQPEVRDWEPHSALFAGSDGMDVLLPLVREAPGALRQGGLLAVEVGEGQAGPLMAQMEDQGAFAGIRAIPDLAGRDRVVVGVASG